jgi:hypothetical protein
MDKELRVESAEIGTENLDAQDMSAVQPVLDTEAIEKTQKELDQLIAENKKKVYGINVKDEETKQIMLDYLEHDVEWRYMESFGVPKIHASIKKEKIKNGNIYLSGLEVEAFSFYLSKAHGKGMVAANRFLKMKEAVDPAYNLREADNRKENSLMQTLEALKQGINVSAQD